MQDKWYADRRDLVKWPALLILARQHQADRILQIAHFRPSKYGEIEIDGRKHPIPPEVLPFFRSFRSVTQLSKNPAISVFHSTFEDRLTYHGAAKEFVTGFSLQRCVVFLDPDTGLQPAKTPHRQEHLLKAEVRGFWDTLPSRWVYAGYQHRTNMAGRPWIEDSRRMWAEAIGLPSSNVHVARAPEIAEDVVLFYAVKP